VEIIGSSYVAYLYWGRPLAQAKIWAREHPGSARAQLRLASTQLLSGLTDEADKTLRQLNAHRPHSLTAATGRLLAGCPDPDYVPGWAAAATARAPTAAISLSAMASLGKILSLKEAGLCASVPDGLLTKLLSQLLENRAYRTEFSNLHLLRGRIAFLQHDLARAFADYDAAYRLTGDPIIRLRMARHSLAQRKPDRAALYYLQALTAFERHPVARAVFAREISSIRRSLARAAVGGNLASPVQSGKPARTDQ